MYIRWFRIFLDYKVCIKILWRLQFMELVKKIKQSSFIVLGQTDKLKILPRDGTRDKPWQSRKGRSNTEKRRSKTRKDVLKQKIWYFFLKNFNQFYPGTKGHRDVLSLGINRLSATSLVVRLTTVLYGKTGLCNISKNDLRMFKV